MQTKQSATAARYLRIAATDIEVYGDNDPIAMLVAELYGAAAYGEGNISEIAARLVAAKSKAEEDAQ